MKQLNITREILESKILDTLQQEYDRWNPHDDFECEFYYNKNNLQYFVECPFILDESGELEYNEVHAKIITGPDSGKTTEVILTEKSIFNLQLKVEQFLGREEKEKNDDVEHVKGIEETEAFLDLNYR